jgi:hypothetical protein
MLVRVPLPIACACGFLAACGGQVGGGVSGASPEVRSGTPGGTGFYTLSIESMSESCQPPRTTGDLGDQLVSVGASGIDMGIWFSPMNGALDNDVSFTTTTEFDVGPASCPKGVLHVSLGPAARTTTGGLDVPVTEVWEGVASCLAPSPDAGPLDLVFDVPAADCESRRVYHYQWSHPCPAPDAGGLGVHCG